MREAGRRDGSGARTSTVIHFDFANTMRAASMNVRTELCPTGASLSLVAVRSARRQSYDAIAPPIEPVIVGLGRVFHISGWPRSRSERRATSNSTGPERSEGPLKPLTLP